MINKEWYENYTDLESIARDMSFFIKNEKFAEARVLLEVAIKVSEELKKKNG